MRLQVAAFELPRPSAGMLGVALACAAASVAGGSLLTSPGGIRLALAGVVGLLVVGFGALAPRNLLFALLVWLAALGSLRRIASGLTDTTHADPLLLVAPLALIVLCGAAAPQAFRRRSALANAVLVLSVLLTLGALNPLQGSLAAGLAGLLFVLVPMLAFWVGRGLCDDPTLVGVVRLAAGLGILGAAYGLAQTFVGFPSWDTAWVARSGYAALHVGDTIRPFASFSAASEYGYFCAIAIVAWVGLGLRRSRLIPLAAAVTLLGVAVFYQSSRGVLAVLVFALGLMLGARRRLPLPVSAAGCVLLLGLVSLAAARLEPSRRSSDAGAQLATHQLSGLANPFDPASSTVGVHLSLVARGLETGFTQPLGIGVGAVSIAGRRFGGVDGGTEADPSNVAVALGLPGLLAYLAVLVLGFRRAYSRAVHRRDRLSLVALGILAVTLFQWLNGGQYAVAFLPWLVLGWLDRPPPSETRT